MTNRVARCGPRCLLRDGPLRRQRRTGPLVARQSGCAAGLAGHGLQVCDQSRAAITSAETPLMEIGIFRSGRGSASWANGGFGANSCQTGVIFYSGRASGSLCAEAGTKASPLSPRPLPPLATLFLRFAPDGFVPDEVEHSGHNRDASVAYAPTVLGIIPECRADSVRNIRSASCRNPHPPRVGRAFSTQKQHQGSNYFGSPFHFEKFRSPRSQRSSAIQIEVRPPVLTPACLATSQAQHRGVTSLAAPRGPAAWRR